MNLTDEGVSNYLAIAQGPLFSDICVHLTNLEEFNKVNTYMSKEDIIKNFHSIGMHFRDVVYKVLAEYVTEIEISIYKCEKIKAILNSRRSLLEAVEMTQVITNMTTEGTTENE